MKHPTSNCSFYSYSFYKFREYNAGSWPQGNCAFLKGGNPMDILRIILAIILPPLGVFLQVGFGKHFWINIILTLLGYIPGIVHAVWVIAKY